VAIVLVPVVGWVIFNPDGGVDLGMFLAVVLGVPAFLFVSMLWIKLSWRTRAKMILQEMAHEFEKDGYVVEYGDDAYHCCPDLYYVRFIEANKLPLIRQHVCAHTDYELMVV